MLVLAKLLSGPCHLPLSSASRLRGPHLTITLYIHSTSMAVTPKGDSQWLMPLYNPFPLSMEPVTCFWPTVYGKGDGTVTLLTIYCLSTLGNILLVLKEKGAMLWEGNVTGMWGQPLVAESDLLPIPSKKMGISVLKLQRNKICQQLVSLDHKLQMRAE